MPVSLRVLARGRIGLAIRDGELRSRTAVRTAAQVVCPGFRFTAVGLVWRGRDHDIIRADIQTTSNGRAFARDRIVRNEPDEGPSPGSPDYDPHRQAADLLWTGPRRCVRLSLLLPGGAELSHLQAAFVNTSGTGGPLSRGAQVDRFATAAREGAAERVAAQGTAAGQAGIGRPSIISRAGWGASPRFFDTGTPGCRAPYYSPEVKVAYIHHTAGSNSYSPSQSDDVVRAIYWFHTQERGFCDIAYNFLISKYGQIFEGRAGGIDQPVTPGSQAGFNPNTFSVSAMGNFQTASPTQAMLASLKRLLAWRLDVAHVPPLGHDTLVSQGGDTTRYPAGTKVTLPSIVGHRVTGLTSCPGYHLFRNLAAIRRAVASMGLPKILRPRQTRVRLRVGAGSVGMAATSATRLAWTVSIRDRGGGLVRTLHDRGRSLSVVWNGEQEDGTASSAGKYRAFLGGRDGAGRAARPAMLPLELLAPGSSSVTSVAGPSTRESSAVSRAGAVAMGGGFRILNGVAGTGPGDLWAVGGAMAGPVRGHPVALHRSSSGWHRVAVPSPGRVSGFLNGVAAFSPGDAWAVGYRCGRQSCAGGGFGERTLIEQATGGTWRVVPSPNPDTGGNRLNAVAAVSRRDAWAVGDVFDEGLYLHQPLLAHWDGTRWVSVDAPLVPAQDVNMTGLLALSTSDVWAVGHGCLGDRGCGGAPGVRPVVLHYDGARWSLVRTAALRAAGSSLQGIAGTRPNDLSAVGWRATTRHSNSRPLVERLVGGRWRVGSAPRTDGILFSADTAPAAPVWAVGDSRARGGFRTLAARRTPHGWKAVSTPSPAGRMTFLSSVAVLSRNNVWATGPSVTGSFLLHWNGTRWILIHPG